ncbi:MAG TPA: hypothetical protein VM368_06580 [Flavisolibacter sp.]|nr:hypothetical protein [Flavisolibacter sp.]
MIQMKMEEPSFHPVLRTTAKIISYLFHPLFIPIYIGWFFIYVLRLFPEHDEWQNTLLLIQFFVNFTMLPLVTVLLAKGLGFIDSIYLKTPKERIIPYVASTIFYFWVWYVFKNQNYPNEIVMFSLAIFLTSSIGLILNSFFKVSMHGLSVGVMVCLIMILSLTSSSNFGVYISVALLITGLVCTSRLINTDHVPFEVYAGVVVGIFMQLLAYWLV